MSQEPGGLSSVYSVELLFETPPELPAEALLEAVRARCPGAEPLDPSAQGGLVAFVHTDHPVELADGTVAAQTLVCPADRPFVPNARVEAALQQSWGFPGVREAVGRCRASVLVTDLMARTLPPRERLGLFQNALAGVLDVVPALAIYWPPSGQVVDPRRFRVACQTGEAPRFFAGGLNVRLFSVCETDGDVVMDTLGLTALGLPDLQCHFRGLEPDRLRPVLGNAAFYLFQNGDVIADGHTIEGVEPGSPWRCRHEDALVGPERVVVDLDPGPPFAAGNRA